MHRVDVVRAEAAIVDDQQMKITEAEALIENASIAEVPMTADEEEIRFAKQRTGLIVWVNDVKPAKNLERYGTVHFISKRLHYVALYVDAERAEDVMKNMQRLPYVKSIERSYRNELKTEYSKDTTDKTRYYSV